MHTLDSKFAAHWAKVEEMMRAAQAFGPETDTIVAHVKTMAAVFYRQGYIDGIASATSTETVQSVALGVVQVPPMGSNPSSKY